MLFKLTERAFIIGSLLLSVACTEKGKPFRVHETAKPGGVSTPDNPLVPPSSQTHSTRVQEWEQRFSNGAAGATRLRDIVLPIAAEVLSEARVRDPKSLLNRAVADELIALNRMVLNLKADEKKLPEYRRLVGLYSAVLLLDCTEFKDSCTGYQYFRNAANSEGVLKDFVKQNIGGNRVRMLTLALVLKPRGVWDGELVQMMAALPARSDLAEREKSDLKAAESLISAAIGQISARIQTREEARQFLESAQVWRLTGDSLFKLDDAARLALFRMVGKAGYLQNNGGQRHPDLTRWMDRMKTHPDGVFSQQAKLRSQQLFSPEAVGAKGIGVYDEVTFLIDAVYTHSLTSEAATELIQSLNLSNASLLGAVENYVRLQFLASLYDSAIMAKGIFTAPVATESLLTHAINESAQVRAVWDAFMSQSASLRSLTLRAAKNLTEDERRKVNGLFESFPRSIKQASVYPHIMVLFYMMSQKRFEVYIPRLHRTIDSARLAQLLWEARLTPFLPYSDDNSPLQYYDLLHAFDMAVRTNLFESVNIDTDDLIADTIRRVSETPIAFMDKNFAAVQLRRQDQLHFRNFKESCKELLPNGTPYPRSMYFGELRSSTYYGFLKSLGQTSIASFNTDPTANSGVEKKVAGLFYPSNDFNESIESARLDLGTVERMGQMMIKSYESFLLKHKRASPSVIAQKTIKARAALEAVRLKRTSIVSQAREFYREFGYCYLKFAINEARKGESLLAYETEYLRHIHRQIKRLRDAGTPAIEKDQITASVRLSGLPSNFTGYDAIFADGYRYNSVDLWVRIARYHMQGLKVGANVLPALSPHMDYSFGQKLDLDVDVVRNSKGSFIPYVESEDEFAASGIRAIFQAGNHFLHWERNYSTIRDYFNTLVSLYRSEFNMTGEAKAITAKEIIGEFQDVFDFMKLTPLRRAALHQLRRETWDTTLPLLQFNYLFLRVNYDDTDKAFGALTGVWGLYDYLFSLMGNEQLGYHLASRESGLPTVALPQREVLFSAGRNYFTSRSELFRGNPVLPVNPDMDSIMDQNVGRFVRSELRAVNEFYGEIMSTIREQQKLSEAQRPRVDLTTKMSITKWYTEATATDFDSRSLTFHQQTNNMFK